MVKLKWSPKTRELDEKSIKKRVIRRFSAASGKCRGKRRIPLRRVPRNTAGNQEVRSLRLAFCRLRSSKNTI